ncbi:MAG: TatD family hydrolase [Minisyncoccales bacterium]|jgi:TatD DNase family protein
MKIIDTHAHLNFRDFESDRDAVIKRSIKEGVWMINVGSQYETSKRAVEIAQKYDEGVYASVGLHPIHTADGFDRDRYFKIASSNKVVAIGEAGIDNYNRPKSRSKRDEFQVNQIKVFEDQLQLAQEMDLPMIVHCRSAHSKMIDVLSKHKARGVIHCFTGSWQDAQSYLDLGFFLGFNGIVFKLDLNDTIKRAPIDRILVETDCPYLTPPRREGRNEPSFIEDVIEFLAQQRGESIDFLTEATNKNAKNLFRI